MYVKGKIIRKKRKTYNTPGHAHELTFSCYKGIPFFRNEKFRTFYTTAVRLAKEKHSFDIWAYVVMPEHIHMLIFPTLKNYSVSSIVKSIKQSTSRKAIGWLKQNKSEFLKRMSVGQKYERHRFWQDGGGYDRNIFTYKAARSSVDYMHQNPVRRKLVESPHLWEYSSFLYWQKSIEGPIDVCLTKFPTG